MAEHTDLTLEGVRALAKRHVAVQGVMYGNHFCVTCLTAWPCEVSLLCASAERWLEETAMLRVALTSCMQSWGAWTGWSAEQPVRGDGGDRG